MSRGLTKISRFSRFLILASFIILVIAALDFFADRSEDSSDPASRRLDTRHLTNSIGMDFVLIQPGDFVKGTSSAETGDYEKPAHTVTISQSYYMAATEVTQAQWKAVMGNSPSKFRGDNLPVEQVSWDDAQDFIRRLNSREETTRYRLPTEAEWEYACRAGMKEDQYPDLECVAWFDPGSEGTTHSVGQKQPNAWGLFDMLGNVYEWCEDWKGTYPSGKTTDPRGPSSGAYRVVRGGSWYVHSNRTKSYFRDFFPQGSRRGDIGFRVVSGERHLQQKESE